MKKFIVLVLLLAIVASGAFALDRNWGFGMGIYSSTTHGTIANQDWEIARLGTPMFLFFGLNRFMELNLGMTFKYPYYFEVNGREVDAWDLGSTFALQAGLYGKWPIPLGRRFVFFPTVGADFEFSFLDEYEGMEWWHDLWLRAGAGMDFFLGQRFFLRSHLLFGVGIPFGGEEGIGLSYSTGFKMKFGLGWMF
jgi:hypothetical protein